MVLIIEVMIFLQIKVINGKNSSVILTQALTVLKYIQNLSEITISEPTLRHDNYAEQLVTDCNGDGVKRRRELQVSQIPYYKNQI